MKVWKTILILTFLVILVVSVFLVLSSGENLTLRVLHAGSLTIPLNKVKNVFEAENSGVKVLLESGGSVESVRKIVDYGKSADVIAVADYKLIENLMLYQNYTDFYIKFAVDELVLAYTNKSRYAEEISKENWYVVLSRKDVRLGFSDPNKDPCGYRSLAALALAQIYYEQPNLFRCLVENYTNIKLKADGQDYIIIVPEKLSLNGGKVIIRAKSVDLLALLEDGIIDYAFEYKGVATQHKLNFVEFPPQVNLGSPNYEKFYSKVSIKLFVGSKIEQTIVTSPIVYGITIPKNAKNPELGIKFITKVLEVEGKRIFEDSGLPPILKPSGYGKIPEPLLQYVELEE
ncbi:MAG: tungstate ABC transporter substrate-binding protein WtpA [Candidatus Bathyarchaeota archaeon]|nr:tungstate ABC transporter substrate-binding protein WtpA [Candidatus Bathyarchaeota archaeon]